MLSGGSWAFARSYTPPVLVEGAQYAPVVYDNGADLVVAQAPEDFPNEAIQPSLEQIAENLKGGGRNGAQVNIRLRKIEEAGEGISKPVILGEVIKDLKESLSAYNTPGNNTSINNEAIGGKASDMFDKENLINTLKKYRFSEAKLYEFGKVLYYFECDFYLIYKTSKKN